MDRELRTLRFVAATILAASLAFAPLARAMPKPFDSSVETALAINHAARRQAENVSKAVTAAKGDRAAADRAYETAYSNAIWEGVKLANPDATNDQRRQMVGVIQSANMVSNAAAGSILGDAAYDGEITASQEAEADFEADEFFKFAYLRFQRRERLRARP